MQIHKHCASEVDILDYTGQAKLDGSTKRSTVLHDEAQRCFYTAVRMRGWYYNQSGAPGCSTIDEPHADSFSAIL